MKTKIEIMNELSKESSETLLADPNKLMQQMLNAFDSGDLKAIMAATLSDIVAHQVVKREFIELSHDRKRLLFFKLVFSALKIHIETERIYSKQFVVSENATGESTKSTKD